MPLDVLSFWLPHTSSMTGLEEQPDRELPKKLHFIPALEKPNYFPLFLVAMYSWPLLILNSQGKQKNV